MDNEELKRLADALMQVRMAYGEIRASVRALRARTAPDLEAAYWIGVTQACSKRISDDLMTLDDAILHLETLTRNKK